MIVDIKLIALQTKKQIVKRIILNREATSLQFRSSVTNTLTPQSDQYEGSAPRCFSKALFTSSECARMDLCFRLLLPSPPRGGGEALQRVVTEQQLSTRPPQATTEVHIGTTLQVCAILHHSLLSAHRTRLHSHSQLALLSH